MSTVLNPALISKPAASRTASMKQDQQVMYGICGGVSVTNMIASLLWISSIFDATKHLSAVLLRAQILLIA
jgi:hypothetical protein